MIPSLQALRNSADIHKKVNARYQELEDNNQIEQGSLELLLQSLHKKVKNDKFVQFERNLKNKETLCTDHFSTKCVRQKLVS